MCRTLTSLHGHINAYNTGSYGRPIVASTYATHMKEAKQWNSAFRPFYVQGSMPSEFQGSLQPPLQRCMPLRKSSADVLWTTSHAPDSMWDMPGAVCTSSVATSCRLTCLT